jgi:hypothetical protein
MRRPVSRLIRWSMGGARLSRQSGPPRRGERGLHRLLDRRGRRLIRDWARP